MNRWVRVGGWAVLALVALWVVWEVLTFVLGLVWGLVSLVVSLAVLALLVYLAYALVSRVLGGSDDSGRSHSRERERIYE